MTGDGFREAIAFEDANAGARKPVSGVEAEGRASRDVVADAAAEAGAELLVNERIGDFPGRR